MRATLGRAAGTIDAQRGARRVHLALGAPLGRGQRLAEDERLRRQHLALEHAARGGTAALGQRGRGRGARQPLLERRREVAHHVGVGAPLTREHRDGFAVHEAMAREEASEARHVARDGRDPQGQALLRREAPGLVGRGIAGEVGGLQQRGVRKVEDAVLPVHVDGHVQDAHAPGGRPPHETQAAGSQEERVLLGLEERMRAEDRGAGVRRRALQACRDPLADARRRRRDDEEGRDGQSRQLVQRRERIEQHVEALDAHVVAPGADQQAGLARARAEQAAEHVPHARARLAAREAVARGHEGGCIQDVGEQGLRATAVHQRALVGGRLAHGGEDVGVARGRRLERVLGAHAERLRGLGRRLALERAQGLPAGAGQRAAQHRGVRLEHRAHAGQRLGEVQEGGRCAPLVSVQDRAPTTRRDALRVPALDHPARGGAEEHGLQVVPARAERVDLVLVPQGAEQPVLLGVQPRELDEDRARPTRDLPVPHAHRQARGATAFGEVGLRGVVHEPLRGLGQEPRSDADVVGPQALDAPRGAAADHGVHAADRVADLPGDLEERRVGLRRTAGTGVRGRSSGGLGRAHAWTSGRTGRGAPTRRARSSSTFMKLMYASCGRLVGAEVLVHVAVGEPLRAHVVEVVRGREPPPVVEQRRRRPPRADALGSSRVEREVRRALHRVAEPGGQVALGVGPGDRVRHVERRAGPRAGHDLATACGSRSAGARGPRSGRPSRKSKMPVSAHWCSPNVS